MTKNNLAHKTVPTHTHNNKIIRHSYNLHAREKPTSVDFGRYCQAEYFKIFLAKVWLFYLRTSSDDPEGLLQLRTTQVISILLRKTE